MHTPGTQMMLRGTLLRQLRGGFVQLRLPDGSLLTTSAENVAVPEAPEPAAPAASPATSRKRK